MNPKGRDRREKVRWTLEQGTVQADCVRRRRTAGATKGSRCVSPLRLGYIKARTIEITPFNLLFELVRNTDKESAPPSVQKLRLCIELCAYRRINTKSSA